MTNGSQHGVSAWSGAGLVAANMIGAGVLLSTGFMAQSLSPGAIMSAWLVGMVLALTGTVAYGAIALQVHESGGEYRYLSRLVHPVVGSLAGWGSLFFGFSAPIAVDALAVGAFARKLGFEGDGRWIATAVLVVLTVWAATGNRFVLRAQNVLVTLKVAGVLLFLVLAMALGSTAWPTWEPTNPVAPVRGVLENQYWIAFAFSGWNAAIYAASEFRDPSRDVPKATWVGCLGVGVLYLLLNAVFVANVTPADASAVFQYEENRVTLAHIVASRLFGSVGAAWVSAFVILAFLSAMSAMVFVGPRVYAEMGRDGALPSMFATSSGAPPRLAVLLQGLVALAFVWSSDVLGAVLSASAFLMLMTALTSGSVLRLQPAPALGPRVAAAVYAVTMLVFFATALSSAGFKVIIGYAAVVILALGSRVAQLRQSKP